jgi:acyl-CoA reductase-like NAD-dependent aldehyde dehydrogenase
MTTKKQFPALDERPAVKFTTQVAVPAVVFGAFCTVSGFAPDQGMQQMLTALVAAVVCQGGVLAVERLGSNWLRKYVALGSSEAAVVVARAGLNAAWAAVVAAALLSF